MEMLAKLKEAHAKCKKAAKALRKKMRNTAKELRKEMGKFDQVLSKNQLVLNIVKEFSLEERKRRLADHRSHHSS